MPQFKAGYVSDAVASVIANKRKEWNMDEDAHRDEALKLDGLLANVCSFDVKFFKDSPQTDFVNLHPVLATLNNIITRGLPTRVPVDIEGKFELADLLMPKIGNGIQYQLKNCVLDYNTLFELLHVIEPGLKIGKQQYAGNPESKLEWEFINQHEYLKQILQSQRDFATISSKMVGGRRVDYCFTIPYHFWSEAKAIETRGHIFEIDGSQHNSVEYSYYDDYRDEQAAQNGYDTIRITAGAIKRNTFDYHTVLSRPYFQQLINNFNRPPTKEIKQAYSLIFIPIAIARIHKTLIEYFIRNRNVFKKDVILRLAIVERDFPCGAMAVQTMQSMFQNLNDLILPEQRLFLPQIELTICRDKNDWCISEEFECGIPQTDEKAFNAAEYDIVIDHSVLRRVDVYKEATYTGKENTIMVRSAHYADNTIGTARRTYCADMLVYKPLVSKQSDGSFLPTTDCERAITYFLQNIFRKLSFREGQLPIIDRALRQLPVVGLLPTGGGKSIAYQLPALLQPGLCIVVDPIKSLMEDQVRVLRENNFIDCCDFVNSNLDMVEKKKRLARLTFGESHFLFVSPERFVMEEFRKKISNIHSYPHGFALSFAYCVIDEVHCVSEWGHDFRTTYLMLGKNAQEQMYFRQAGKKVPLIGLTATASFDVLADIERELQIDHAEISEAIIAIENTIRPELFFRVIDVTGKDRCEELNKDFASMGPNISKINNRDLLEQSERHHFDEFEKDNEKKEFHYNDKYLIKDWKPEDKKPDDLASIIFCPVKGTRTGDDGEFLNKSGVCHVHRNLLASTKKGFFFGSGKIEEDGTETDDDTHNKEVHKHFRDFLNGKLQHMVCTKAFGMGIDKEDVRTTYHYYYSGSLESLVQECGRAGRDQKIAEANILLSQASYYVLDVHLLFAENRKSFLPLSFGGAKNRRAIRNTLSRKWNEDTKKFDAVKYKTIEEAIAEISKCEFSMLDKDGNVWYRPSEVEISQLRQKLLEKDDNGYKYLKNEKEDRGIHEFFHRLTFKGIETEEAQLRSLFHEPENGKVLADKLYECQPGATFDFILQETKCTTDVEKIVCKLLRVNPDALHYNRATKTNGQIVDGCFKYAADFEDLISQLGENGYGNLPQNEAELHNLYHKDRKIPNDTGRLIYRMSCIGLLVDYKIDYLTKLYICKFRKHHSIDDYLSHIEQYFRRYLSENAALAKVDELNEKLRRTSLIDDILECLFFLTEFSYQEIAEKRRRATDQIEEVMHNAAAKDSWFEQNKYIKEEIYFYFNAKYARAGYSSGGKGFSLYDDYYVAYRSRAVDRLTRGEILTKYLDVYKNDEGTHQNQYKHMIGSCKKIMRVLGSEEVNREWLLRLLRAFAMFAVNNPSYISEACEQVEVGFMNLYKDDEFQHRGEMIGTIFDEYFRKLDDHIRSENMSFGIIKVIRLKLLQELQRVGVITLVDKQISLT